MSNNETTNSTDAGRRRRSQREPAGDGESSVLLDVAPSPAVSDPTPTITLLAQLDRQREANGGWLVPPPPEHVLQGAQKVERQTRTGSRIPEANNELIAVGEWFAAIDAAGGTRTDLGRALQHWVALKPSSVAVRHLRDELLDDLEHKAVVRAGRQGTAMAEERLPAELLEVNRRALAQEQRELREAEEHADRLRRKVRKRKVLIEHLLEQYPHLNTKPAEAA